VAHRTSALGVYAGEDVFHDIHVSLAPIDVHLTSPFAPRHPGTSHTPMVIMTRARIRVCGRV
jgi:hypothetical protein